MTLPLSGRRIVFAAGAVLACLLLMAAHAGTASAAGGWWVLGSTSAPTNLQPGHEGFIDVQAVNSGYDPIESTSK